LCDLDGYREKKTKEKGERAKQGSTPVDPEKKASLARWRRGEQNLREIRGTPRSRRPRKGGMGGFFSRHEGARACYDFGKLENDPAFVQGQ